MQINPFQNENIIQHRNLTNSQRRNINTTREGVVVNSFVKENEVSLNNTKDTYIISG